MGKVWLGVAVILTIGHPLSDASAQDQAVDGKVDQSLAPYASIANSVRLADGRTIHFTCAGHGSPTVILTTYAGGWGIDWNKVQPAIAARTRVCAWDRAGFGLSSPSSRPQTVNNTSADLEEGLARGGLAGPYVLVGHSTGAYESLMVADRQPKAVVGMVLVDPSIPDQEARFERVVPAQTHLAGTSEDQPFVKALRKCVAAIRTGVVRPGLPDPDQCLRPPPIPPNYPEPLRDLLAKQEATATPAMSASAMETIASYLGALDEDGRMVVSPHRNYRNMPLIVLTAGKFNVRADATQAFRDEVPARQAEWKRAHDEYAALSRRGVNRMVPSSAHIIPQEKPQAVIDAVVEVIDATSGTHNRAQ